MSKLWNKIKAWWGGLFGTSTGTSTSTSTAAPAPASQTGIVNQAPVTVPLPALLEETAPTGRCTAGRLSLIHI